MSTVNFVSGIKYYDDKYFPYHFSKSGNFSLEESEILTNCGYIMSMLKSGEMKPESEEHEHFLSVINGKHKPLYRHEFIYLKYLNLIRKKQSPFIDIKKASNQEVVSSEYLPNVG